jgi:hypothetical protein
MGVGAVYEDPRYRERIRQLQEDRDAPEIIYIPDYLSEEEMAGLYTACDCLVHPYRGEGFGLPVAEAMASGCPVIVTKGGACDDFCTDEIVYWIPAKRVDITFDDQTTELFGGEIPGAWLLNPNRQAFVEQMRHVVGHCEEAREKGRRASTWIHTNFSWDRSAQIIVERLASLRDQPVWRERNKRVEEWKSGRVEEERVEEWKSGRVEEEKDGKADESSIPPFLHSSIRGGGEERSIPPFLHSSIRGGGEERSIPPFLHSSIREVGGGEVDALILEGEQLFEEGDLFGAEERFREALRRDERTVRAYNDLGVVGWKKGDLHTALSSFNRALELDLWNGDALVNSAEVYRTLGYRDEAIVRLRRYLQIHGDDQEIKRELNKLLGEKV